MQMLETRINLYNIHKGLHGCNFTPKKELKSMILCSELWMLHFKVLQNSSSLKNLNFTLLPFVSKTSHLM